MKWCIFWSQQCQEQERRLDEGQRRSGDPAGGKAGQVGLAGLTLEAIKNCF